MADSAVTETVPEIAMRPVVSSHVDAIGYDAEKQELHVSYRGRRAIYAAVPAEVAKTVEDSPSVGQALRTWVRGNYEFRYATQQPVNDTPMNATPIQDTPVDVKPIQGFVELG